MGNQQHISPLALIGFFAGILLGIVLTLFFVVSPDEVIVSSSRQEQQVAERWELDRESTSIGPATRVPSLPQETSAAFSAAEVESGNLGKVQAASPEDKTDMQIRVGELKREIQDLHAQLVGANYTLMLAIEDPDSTPYGSFLASTAGGMATFDERRDAWYTLSDLPVRLSETESIWLLDMIQKNRKGVVPLKAAIAFLGPGRVYKEVPREKLLELKDYYEDREWEAMFPAYLRTDE